MKCFHTDIFVIFSEATQRESGTDVTPGDLLGRRNQKELYKYESIFLFK